MVLVPFILLFAVVGAVIIQAAIKGEAMDQKAVLQARPVPIMGKDPQVEPPPPDIKVPSGKGMDALRQLLAEMEDDEVIEALSVVGERLKVRSKLAK